MKKILKISAIILYSITSLNAREYHVSINGNDKNNGTEQAPFRTIQTAANFAVAGDVITVHEGTYREWVNPIHGGESNLKRIIYRAAPGETVEIKGSEVVDEWKEENGIWRITIPNTFFGTYNPYKEKIEGDWYVDYGRDHHTGEVFINGKSLYEVESLEKVINPTPWDKALDKDASLSTWYCESDDENTIIWANFHTYNPRKDIVEISVRNTCFYPSNPGINYITVSGFHFSQAATQWAAPTAEQVGMVATHWNKGWIIENNTISDSRCSGITLGKERSTGHNVVTQYSSLYSDGAIQYIEVIFRALRNGWSKENIGSHIIRGNTIYNCEQTAICGSFGAAFSIIENNHIYNIHAKRQFGGWEDAGIKFHGAIDTQIRKNRIHDTSKAIWLDWMSQGVRVSQNLLYRNQQDLSLEANHGPAIFDNNIFGSPFCIYNHSQGSAFIHNLFLGTIYCTPTERYTPYFLPHSTTIAGLSYIAAGDDRYINNVFAPAFPKRTSKGQLGLAAYDDISKKIYSLSCKGNVYYDKAQTCKDDTCSLFLPELHPNINIIEEGKSVYLEFDFQQLKNSKEGIVDSRMLGNSLLARLPYEQPTGESIIFNTDYWDISRRKSPLPGPFENISSIQKRLKVW